MTFHSKCCWLGQFASLAFVVHMPFLVMGACQTSAAVATISNLKSEINDLHLKVNAVSKVTAPLISKR